MKTKQRTIDIGTKKGFTMANRQLAKTMDDVVADIIWAFGEESDEMEMAVKLLKAIKKNKF